MMTVPLDKLMQARKKLGNQYAYLEELEAASHVPADAIQTQSNQVAVLQNPYASLDSAGVNTVKTGELATVRHEKAPDVRKMDDPYVFVPGNADPLSRLALSGNPYAVLADEREALPTSSRKPMSANQIENIVRKLQLELWQKRHDIFPEGKPVNPIDLLSPEVICKVIGYEYIRHSSLEGLSNGADFKVAGVVDQVNSKIHISDQFPPEMRRFTAAHELGHVFLNHEVGLHRDRALDGSPVEGNRGGFEYEADKFAANLLMPARLVSKKFKELFGTDCFIVDEHRSFALDPDKAGEILRNKSNLRYISRFLASAKHYNGNHFLSLAEQFGVSIVAMAIRLEELGLVKVG